MKVPFPRLAPMLAVLLVALFGAVPVAAQTPQSPRSADEIQECVQRNQTHASSRGTIEFLAVDRIGAESSKKEPVSAKPSGRS